MNVTELARRMKLPTDTLLEKLPEWGFHIGRRAIKIDDRQAHRILRLWQDGEIHLDAAQKEKQAKTAVAHAKEIGPVAIPSRVVVSQLAASLHLPVTAVIKELMKNGVMATLNQEVDYETAAIIAEDLGFQVTRHDEANAPIPASKDIKVMVKEEGEDLVTRPPIIVVMGHVDHGKTKLLDAIRKTNVMGGESGGITQHIGAYQIEKNGQMLTFLDTPGHEAFRAMRARGGRAADIAVLVVSAVDGIQPQTKEAIQIIQQEKLPFVVAINKMDAPGADQERVKRELAELNLLPEDWGGKTVCVPVSAKLGQGVDDLIATLLLVADLEGFKANPKRDAIGTIVEAHMDSGEGAVTTVLVHTGTLRKGDLVIVGEVGGKVRMLKNYRGELVEEAPPGTPVRVLGLKGVPQMGDILEVTHDAALVKSREKARKSHQPKERVELGSLTTVTEDEREGIKKIKLILKSDMLGSEEAIIESLAGIHNPEVGLHIIGRGLGNITENDVLQAEAAGAEILAFRVLLSRAIEGLASSKKVMIRRFEIIYDLLDHVRAELEALLAPEVIRTDYGAVKVLAIFRAEARYTILGGAVTEGKLVPGAVLAVMHENGTERGRGTLQELQKNKIVVSEVEQGSECGMRLEGKARVHEGDILYCFKEEVRQKKLV